MKKHIKIGKITYRIVFARNGYTNRNGTRQVVVSCSLDGQSITFPTGLYLKPDQLENGIVVNHSMASLYNRFLYQDRDRIEATELSLIFKGKIVTLSGLKAAVENGYLTENTGLAEFIDKVLDNSVTRSDTTKQSYETLKKQTLEFDKGAKVSSIDLDWVNRFYMWLKDKGLAPNTVIGRLKSLRAIMNEAIKRKIITSDDDPFKFFKIPTMSSREEFLTFGEIKRIENLKLRGRKAHIRDAFLFACWTGFRYSDLIDLRTTDLKEIRGKTWIFKKPKKTAETSGITVQIPLYCIFDGKPMELLKKYSSIESLVKIGNNASANRTLKEIIKLAKIPEERHITFHVARHTTATLLLYKGVPVTTVQKILGHTKLETTQIYAKVTDVVVKTDIEKAFKPKKDSV